MRNKTSPLGLVGSLMTDARNVVFWAWSSVVCTSASKEVQDGMMGATGSQERGEEELGGNEPKRLDKGEGRGRM